MEQNEYHLIIRIPFKAMDHPQARQMAREVMKATPVSDEAVVKLQQVKKGKEPIGVKL
ncbi:MAG: hypothetical protein GF334_06705 [Candidatus Altiarchaeales archaeon]|nr:hypothetical protein [Candidatus Altiarchaeales archaeon]